MSDVRPVFEAPAPRGRGFGSRVPEALARALRDVFLLELEPGTDVRSLAAELAAHPEIVYAEPNYLYRVDLDLPPAPAEVDDPFVTRDGRHWSEGSWGQSFPDLWGLRSIRALEGWARFDLDGSGAFGPGEQRPGEGVVVAVVDSGVDTLHPDLAGAIWRNPGEIADNGIDDDGNGFVDDVQGWDFDAQDAIAEDRFGHGTHVAATIAARTGDAFGIAGVAPWAQILPLKGFSDTGLGDSATLAGAVLYAAEQGADVISNSWGGPAGSQLLRDAFAYARSLGALVVASAGNRAINVESISPAGLPGVITVAALTPAGAAAGFSNFGARVDLTAPGVEVLSASANAGDNTIAAALAERAVGTEHLRLDGTSMAAPHVAGALAVLRGRFPDESPEESVGRLLASAAPLHEPDPEFRKLWGLGVVDLRAALDAQPRGFLTVDAWEIEALRPAATSRVVLRVHNRWLALAGLEAQLFADDPRVSVLQGRAFLGDLGVGAETSNVDTPFLVEFDDSLSFGTSVTLEVRVRGASGFEVSFTTSVTLNFFHDLSDQSGLPLSGDPLPKGATFVDYDGDGRSDLHSVRLIDSQLFRNVAPGRFENTSVSAGLLAFGLGLSHGTFFDADEDGDLDVFLGSFIESPPSRFFENLGEGRFEESNALGEFAALRSFAAVNLDYDLDGATDLFGGARADYSQNALRRESNFLLRGDGSGNFEEVTEGTCLPMNLDLIGGQALTLDYDSDGDADLVMTSPFADLTLYRNDSDGRFTNVSRRLGLLRSFREEVRCQVQTRLTGDFCDRVGGSGLAAGDYDGDGDIDLFVTGIIAGSSRESILFRNDSGKRFVDVGTAAGDLAEGVGGTHWGTAFFDFDNDGDLDLYRTDARYGRGAAYALYRNRGDGSFSLINDLAFPDFPPGMAPQSGVAAVGDLDGDGALDIFADSSTLFGPALSVLLRNQGAAGQHWLRVRLVGVASARDAFGARVTLKSGARSQIREVHTSPVETQPLHFGLGDEEEIDSLKVRWPSGLVQEVHNLRADQLLTLEEPAHCLGERRGEPSCRHVHFEERPDPPRRRRVPRWAREQLEKELICEAEVETLRVRRRVCGRLARECLRRADLRPTHRMLRRGWRNLPPEQLECVLPYTSTVGCEEAPHAELLDVCDCFDLPEEETPASG